MVACCVPIASEANEGHQNEEVGKVNYSIRISENGDIYVHIMLVAMNLIS